MTARSLRPSTISWGVFTLAFGILLLAIASGMRFSLFTLITLALAGLGTIALLLAVLPRPKPRVEVTNEPAVSEELTEIFEPVPATEVLPRSHAHMDDEDPGRAPTEP